MGQIYNPGKCFRATHPPRACPPAKGLPPIRAIGLATPAADRPERPSKQRSLRYAQGDRRAREPPPTGRGHAPVSPRPVYPGGLAIGPERQSRRGTGRLIGQIPPTRPEEDAHDRAFRQWPRGPCSGIAIHRCILGTSPRTARGLRTEKSSFCRDGSAHVRHRIGTEWPDPKHRQRRRGQ